MNESINIKCPKCRSKEIEVYGHVLFTKDYVCKGCSFILKGKRTPPKDYREEIKNIRK